MLWRATSKNSENTSVLRELRTLPVASIAAILYWRSFFLHWESIDWAIYANAQLSLHKITESPLYSITNLLSRWLWWILGFNDWSATRFTESADSFQYWLLHQDNEIWIMQFFVQLVVATAKYHTKSLFILIPSPPKSFLAVQPTNCS